MTTTAACRQRTLLLSLLTLLTLVGAIGLGPTIDASASTHPAAQTRVRAIDHPTTAVVGAEQPGSSTTVGVSGLHLRQLVSATGVATETAGGLSPVAARDVYLAGERGIAAQADELAASGVSAEERARTLFSARNALRTEARGLMADQELAGALAANEPNMTWPEIVAKYQARGFTGEELWNEIGNAASRSRASVNQIFGLSP